VVLSIAIGVAGAAAVMVSVFAVTVFAPVLTPILAAILTAWGLVGLAGCCGCGKQRAGDEQCSTQLRKSSHCRLLKMKARRPAGRRFDNNDPSSRLFRGVAKEYSGVPSVVAASQQE
jgi:hypothetical protein